MLFTPSPACSHTLYNVGIDVCSTGAYMDVRINQSLCWQIVIAVSQIMFCRDLTECLNSEEGSIVDAITVAVKNCITVKKKDCVSIYALS